LEWREINVLDEMDRAVEYGVLSLPAIVIDGELAFASLPTPQQLRAVLIRRSAVEK
jgi:predicted thioredoxin/glutaredoxin